MTDNNAGVAASRSRSPPFVLACGYQQVHIAKSGLFFPAWLIRVVVDDECAQGSARCNNSSTAVVRYVWKSKRDFWRLARKTPGIKFPKAAWSKLTEAAPWKRPDLASILLGGAVDTHLHHDGNGNVGPTSPPPETSTDCDRRKLLEETDNNWKQEMIKGLRQIDQYLQKVSQLSISKGNNAGHDNDDTTNNAWKEFVERSVSREDSVVSAAAAPAPLDASLGNALGQYFCHPLNARQLVRTALQRFQCCMGSSSPTCSTIGGRGSGGAENHLNILFVEPSCGHGQIVEPLLDSLQSPEESSSPTYWNEYDVVGIDVDTTAIAHCKQKFKEKECVKFFSADFLESTPTSIDSIALERKTVVVVGGPPYTAGAGHGGSDEALLRRDLPMLFVRHAVRAYSATVICLLMPARCQKIDYIRDDWIPRDYHFETIPLEAPSVFYFQGCDPVTQPSVIQCFWKITANDKTKP